jgi:hypothetical protein
LLWTVASWVLSLDRRAEALNIGDLSGVPRRDLSIFITGVTLVHIDEVIDGRTYHIELSRVAHDRWRAHIVRTPGVPTAMMPFYGATPDAAARLMSDWLALAHRTARSTPGA